MFKHYAVVFEVRVCRHVWAHDEGEAKMISRDSFEVDGDQLDGAKFLKVIGGGTVFDLDDEGNYV